jgi:hypothetical protein
MFSRSSKSCLPPTGGHQNYGNYGCFGGYPVHQGGRILLPYLKEMPPKLFQRLIQARLIFLDLVSFWKAFTWTNNFFIHTLFLLCLEMQIPRPKTDMCWLFLVLFLGRLFVL